MKREMKKLDLRALPVRRVVGPPVDVQTDAAFDRLLDNLALKLLKDTAAQRYPELTILAGDTTGGDAA